MALFVRACDAKISALRAIPWYYYVEEVGQVRLHDHIMAMAHVLALAVMGNFEYNLWTSAKHRDYTLDRAPCIRVQPSL